MILIPARLRCDWSGGCGITADIELEYTEGSQGIPVLSIHNYPEGWGRGPLCSYRAEDKNCCPKHKANTGR